ncbi:MAG TPA: VWA domain-containing protein [Acidobacteriota bacterium]|nr:VWA domain-containing protein [Acidobacteriota bacterium]
MAFQPGGGDEDIRRPPVISVRNDMVLVRATVTDALNRNVIGLEKEFFRVFEDKVEQDIVHFSNSKSPVSVGFILDLSGSMGDNILSARNSIIRFLEQGDPSDEYFLVTFNDRTAVAQDFTPRGENIRGQVAFTGTKGRTALFDAIYLGLEKLEEGQHDKKALIVITDGEDNSSRYTSSEIQDLAKESDAQIYIIGERGEIGYGRGIISNLVRLTGGRSFYPDSFKQLDYYCDLIHTELRHQYVVGYNPSTADGEEDNWRTIRVRLEAPDGWPKLSIRHRLGYVPRRY